MKTLISCGCLGLLLPSLPHHNAHAHQEDLKLALSFYQAELTQLHRQQQQQQQQQQQLQQQRPDLKHDESDRWGTSRSSPLPQHHHQQHSDKFER
jgi:hypothetical protein